MQNYFHPNLSLSQRLKLGFASVLLLLLCIATMSTLSLRQAGHDMQRVVDVNSTRSELANELLVNIGNMTTTVRSIALLTDLRAVETAAGDFQRLDTECQRLQEALGKHLAQWGSQQDELALFEKVIASSRKTRPVIAQAAKLGQDGDNIAAVAAITTRVVPLEQGWRTQLEEFAALQRQRSTSVAQASTASQHRVIALQLVLAVVSLLGGAWIAWRITASVTGPITSMQTTMTEIANSQDFSRRVPVDRMDEVGLSIVAFNAMIEKIQESSTQLKQKTADIQAMMQYIPQGILTVQSGNRVHPEFSAYLEAILETQDIAGRGVVELVFSRSQCNAEIQSQVEAAIAACIGEDAMNFEFNAHLLVSEVQKTMPDGRVKILDLSWSPITDDGDTVVRVMLCVRDVTEIRQLAAEAGAQKRELEIIGQILAINQEKFHEFVDSSVQFLAENKQLIEEAGHHVGRVVDPEVIGQLFRNMHTIKGNARTYGLLHLTNTVHEAEQSYDALRKAPHADWDQQKLLDELARTCSAVEEYAHINETKLGRKGPGRRGGVDKFLMVQKEQLQQALGILDSLDWNNPGAAKVSVGRVRNCLALIGTDTIDGILAGVTDSLPSLAKELGKEVPQSSIEDHGIVIKNQVADLIRNVFMHLYRNSLDHGLESATDRVASGKSPAGHIHLELFLNEARLQLKLRDDGRGLAVYSIRKKAIEKGLITEEQQLTPVETAQLIFQAGFSTAEHVTEVSGRGVGMDAVKSFVEREGGSIELRFLSPDNGSTDGFRLFETVINLPAKFAMQDTSRQA